MNTKHIKQRSVLFTPAKTAKGPAVDFMAQEQRKAEQHLRDIAADTYQRDAIAAAQAVRADEESTEDLG